MHISQISDKRIDKVTDVLQEGQEVKVLVLDVDNRGRIKLSIMTWLPAEASGVSRVVIDETGPSGPVFVSATRFSAKG